MHSGVASCVGLLLVTCVLADKKENSSTKKPILKPGQTLKASPVENGPDGRPLLFAPKIKMCQNSKWFTLLATPVLVRSQKLSNIGLGQYLDGWVAMQT